MIIESTFKNKFISLGLFSKEVIRDLKKEITKELSKKNSIVQKKLSGVSIGDGKDEVVDLFFNLVVEKGDEELGEWLASSWVLKNSPIFKSFHKKISLISADYEKLTGFPTEKEEDLRESSIEEFGAIKTFIFSVLNSVVFSKKSMEDIRIRAEEEASDRKEISLSSNCSVEEAREIFEKEKKKILEKQEHKLLAVIKRHQVEVEGYRKQIGQLQKKLEEVRA